MIVISKGNLLKADAEALVNSVNCVGFMGKGIALQFKKAYPINFKHYQRACNKGDVKPGEMFIYETESFVNPKFIINFPTKRHWRGASRLEDVRSGLKALVKEIQEREISSIAIPPLGSGLGGLSWNVVRPLIEKELAPLINVHVLLYEPMGAPDPRSMPIGTIRPKLTVARALFIKLMKQYHELDYRLTLLEIQKLAFFLQESGEKLRLRYVKEKYGPYAHNLNMVIEKLEGHFTQGYGDNQQPDVEIELMPNADKEADQFLLDHPDSRVRLDRVSELIDGFETPYGMELLSSVYWVNHSENPPAMTPDEAVLKIHQWNDRKRDMFRVDHIHIAWNRLHEEGWLSV